MYELTVESTFSAAHQLIGSEGPCEALHGHTWKVVVALLGDTLDDIGMLVDFQQVKKDLAQVLKKYDHTFLNKAFTFNPTAENIAHAIYTELKRSQTLVSSVTVWESPTSSARYFEE